MSKYIGPNAKVGDSATVGDSAWVGDSATVGGSAWVGDSATVGGSAWVGGSATVGGSGEIKDTRDYICIGPIGSRNDFFTAHRDRETGVWVNAGCFHGSLEDFSSAVNKKSADDIHRAEYELAIALIRRRFA